MDIPIDIIIKILEYLRKLISRREFLKLRFLRKKIAAAFPQDEYYLDQDSKILPDCIKTISFYYQRDYGDIPEILEKSKHVVKLILKEGIYHRSFNCNFIKVGGNYDHIKSYIGPCEEFIKYFINLEVLITELPGSLENYIPKNKLREIKLYSQCFDTLNFKSYYSLKKLHIIGVYPCKLDAIILNDELELLILEEIKNPPIIKKENTNLQIIFI
jgi:hypothetical protein